MDSGSKIREIHLTGNRFLKKVIGLEQKPSLGVTISYHTYTIRDWESRTLPELRVAARTLLLNLEAPLQRVRAGNGRFFDESGED